MAYGDKQYKENIEATFLDEALCDLWQYKDSKGEEREDTAARRFVSPDEFEAHLQQISPALWPVEFRKAFAFFDSLGDANKMSWGAVAARECLEDLAAYYVPELGTTATQEGQGNAEEAPPYLESLSVFAEYKEGAAQIFRNLKASRFLGDDWKPAQDTEKAAVYYMIYQLNAILYKRSGGLTKMCKAWGVSCSSLRNYDFSTKHEGDLYGDTLKRAIKGSVLEEEKAVQDIAKNDYKITKT